MKKQFIPIILITAILASVGCESHKKKKEKAHFLVTNPLKTDTIITREYVSQINSIQHIEVRALDKGYLKKIYVDEGQYVKKGQLMFKIRPPVYKAEFEKAKAEANFAKIEYLNTKSLSDSNVVSVNQLALKKAKYDKAKAELELAKTHLDFTEIRAPFDGLMDRFKVRLGSLLDEGDLLTTLSDNSKMWIYFNVPEAEYLDYKANPKKDSIIKVKLMMANHKPFKYMGVVETIEADFNNETGNISFRATFPNPDGLLRHGETGKIVIDEPLNNVILIPQKSTFQVLDKTYVYVVGEEGIVKATLIEIVAELPHIFAVKEGGSLSENDKILLEGIRKVRNGDDIEYTYLEGKKVLSDLELYAE